MKYSRAELKNMNEDTLRTKVLKPLLEELGYHDVFHYHGGQGEKGKDLIMWKPGDLGERVNYAIVVKAVRITGKAQVSTGTAGEVTMQIQQAFGHAFLDPITAEHQRISRCWVLSSHEISKEAIESIKAALSTTNLDRNVTFINGDRLWQMVEDTFPDCAAFEKLRAATQIFETLDEDWRVAVSTAGGKNSFFIEPKDPNAQREPLQLTCSFKNNTAGQAKLKEAQAAIETGAPIVIEATHLQGLQMPPFLRNLIGDVNKLEFHANPQANPLPVSVRVDSDDGTRLRIDNITLRAERIGTKEALFSNRQSALPWTLGVLFTFPNCQAVVQFAITIKTGNVHRLLEAARYWEVFSKPGALWVDSADTGLPLVQNRIQGAPTTDTISTHLMTLLEDLDFIQQKTASLLSLPKRAISGKEALHTHYVATLLRNGACSLKNVLLSTTCTRENAQKMIGANKEHTGKSLAICFLNRIEKVFGQAVNLGPIAIHLAKARLTDSCINKLRTGLKSQKSKRFGITFDSLDDSPIQLFCLNAIPKNAKLPPEVQKFVDDNVLDELKKMAKPASVPDSLLRMV
jgi:hypothetical protein